MMKRITILIVAISCMMMKMSAQTVNQHIVQPGETLSSIAQKYGIPEEQLKNANPSIGDYPYSGTKINIPLGDDIENSIPVIGVNDEDQRGNANVDSVFLGNGSDVASSYDNVPTIKNGNYEGSETYFLYQSDAKVYGLNFSMDINSYLNFNFAMLSNMKFGSDDVGTYLGWLGVGAKRRFVFGDTFLCQIKCFPYIGLAYSHISKNVELGIEGEDKTEFTYGIVADASVGLKVWKSKKGKSTFLTVGYQLNASEFETKDLFKNGYFMLGITTIF